MVEKKEKVTDTLQREFHEEVLNFPDIDELSKQKLLLTIKDIFENGGERIYCGYVDDPRYKKKTKQTLIYPLSSFFLGIRIIVGWKQQVRIIFIFF